MEYGKLLPYLLDCIPIPASISLSPTSYSPATSRMGRSKSRNSRSKLQTKSFKKPKVLRSNQRLLIFTWGGKYLVYHLCLRICMRRVYRSYFTRAAFYYCYEELHANHTSLTFDTTDHCQCRCRTSLRGRSGEC